MLVRGNEAPDITVNLQQQLLQKLHKELKALIARHETLTGIRNGLLAALMFGKPVQGELAKVDGELQLTALQIKTKQEALAKMLKKAKVKVSKDEAFGMLDY